MPAFNDNIKREVFTFSPNDPMAELFEEYRLKELEFNHSLVENYQNDNFQLTEQEQLTMYFENGVPTMFSTIFRRSWWLPGCYRVLNRVWKIPRTKEFNKKVYEGTYASTISQVEWCKQQPGFRAAIITRQNNNRILRAMEAELANRGYPFDNNHKLWICQGERSTCYQHASIYGDLTILEEWPYQRN